MPFQALPIALRANTGDATSKLLWVWLVGEADVASRIVTDVTISQVAEFCQCGIEEARAALQRLERLGLIQFVVWDNEGEVKDWYISRVRLKLPMSDLPKSDRRRIKASPDQISMLAARAGHKCAGCGLQDYSEEGWHVDHIIPQSVGGADVEDNLQVLCPTCNFRKGAKVHWVDFLGGRARG